MNALGVRPSFSTGFAQGPGESEYPELWNGLVGFWPIFLGQTGGKVPDFSGKLNHGTLQGTAPSWTSGKSGSAILLPGTDEYINLGEIVGTPARSKIFTWSFWMKADSLPASTGIAAVQNSLTNTTPALLIQSNNNNIRLYVRNSYSDAVAISTGTWYHVLVTYNGAFKADLYLNGVYKVTTTGSNSEVDSDFYIGNGYNGYFDGQIDNITIWNRILPLNEIAFLSSKPTALVQLRRRVVMVSVGVAPAVGNPMLLEGQLMNSPLLSGRLIA